MSNTLYIKDKWEKGSRSLRRVGATHGPFNGQHPTPWLGETMGWKNIARYFKKPHQEKYKGTNTPCWRKCGSTVGNHNHTFWDCPKLKRFWKDMQSSLSAVFNTLVPLEFEDPAYSR